MLQFAVAVCVIAVGYTVVNFVDEYMETRYQKTYETDFLRHHDEFLKNNHSIAANLLVMPLLFDNRDKEALLEHCKQYHKRWKLEHYYYKWIANHEPEVGTRRLAFRRLDEPHDIIQVEALRCNKKFAIITQDKSSGYLLKRNKSKKFKDNEFFYIYTKFVRDTSKPSKTEHVEPTLPDGSISPKHHETSSRDQATAPVEPTSPTRSEGSDKDQEMKSEIVLEKLEKEAIKAGKVEVHDSSSDSESDSAEESDGNGKKVGDDTKIVEDDKKEAGDDQKIADDDHEKKKEEGDAKNGD